MERAKPAFYQNTTVESVDAVLKKLLRSQEQGNIEEFASCFVHDGLVVHIGTDVDEYFTSWREYLHWTNDILNSRKGHQINEKETRIGISEDGITAWYSQLIDTCYETKDEITRIEGFRHTGVLINTPEGWKIIQSHISAPLNTTL
jgi:hypothetical protein